MNQYNIISFGTPILYVETLNMYEYKIRVISNTSCTLIKGKSSLRLHYKLLNIKKKGS